MAIEAVQQKQKQKLLTLIFIIVLFLIFLVVFLGFVRNKKAVVPPIVPTFELETIKINFGVLTNPDLKALETFEEISLPENIGRENPFLPYELIPEAPEMPEIPEVPETPEIPEIPEI